MERGKLYGVSVGPGDPELLTLRAARVLREVDCVAAPDLGGSSARTALNIVGEFIQGKQLIDCASPMTSDKRETGLAYDAIADTVSALLDQGKSVAFVTLGDASVYSSWSYLNERMKARGYEVEVVPGVTSFNAAAARLGESLCERSELLTVVPGSSKEVGRALQTEGTKVFMKSGKRLGELRDTLRENGLASSSSLVANCGLEGEEVMRDLSVADELPGGMAIVITKGTASNAESSPCDVEGSVSGEARSQQGDRSTAVTREGSAAERRCEPHEAFRDVAERIVPADETARQAAVDKWNAVAKPIGSLGVLEDIVADIAALTGSADVCIDKRAVVVLCADNGVVAQGISQCGPEVTRSVAVSLGKGVSSVCSMAHKQGIDVVPVNMGMMDPVTIPGCADPAAFPSPVPGVLERPVQCGTNDITQGPAMTRDQALQALRQGIDLVGELKGQGYQLLVSGEMGIGNTTTSSAMTAALLGLPVAEVTGRGAGLDDEGLKRKVNAITRALEVNAPDPADALDVLAKLGGFDIAGIAGLFIGGALHRVPVVIDGYISALAAYTASRLVPSCTQAMLASHMSAEPAARIVMGELGLQAPIRAGLRLGEGTGGICLVPLIDMALGLYNGITFNASGIDAYDPDLMSNA